MDDPERQAGEAGRSTLVPAWVLGATNLFAMLVTAVLVGVALFLIGWFSPVLAPLGLGLFIAALAAPLFSRLVDRGRSAAVALTITVAVVLLVGAVVVAIALLSARSLSESMDAYAGAIRARSADASGDAASRSPSATSCRRTRWWTSSGRWSRSSVDVGSSLAFAVVIAALLLLDRRAPDAARRRRPREREPDVPRDPGASPARRSPTSSCGSGSTPSPRSPCSC